VTTTSDQSRPDLADFARSLDEMARSTDLLLARIDTLAHADLRAPSLLPGWTRGHVLTHVARSADGLANLAHWARTGEPREMYPGGEEGRAADIEAGASRHIGDVRLDVADASERLLGAFADFREDALAREVTARGAGWYGWELPLMRIREVEIHHVDLAAGYSPADWSPEFVARTLDQLAPQFVARGDCPVRALRSVDGAAWPVGADGPDLVGQPAALLAWLVGRAPGADLSAEPSGDVPAAPRWR
jgi:maleylpyruvate isomerase